jgi:hypothetical protein
MKVKVQLMVYDVGHEETVTEVVVLEKPLCSAKILSASLWTACRPAATIGRANYFCLRGVPGL